jgi:hypothetical protein
MGRPRLAVPAWRLDVNSLYDSIRYELLTGVFDWTAIDLQLIAWRGTPQFVATEKTVTNFKAHGAATEAGRSLDITSQTVSANGTAQTNQVVIPAVPVGAALTHFTMVRKHPTVPDSSDLILYIDEAFELPFVPNGLDMLIQPDWLTNRGWWRP